MWSQDDATYRHARHALADFAKLRRQSHGNRALWHALSHHLRHVVFRTGLRLPARQRHHVRRSSR